MLSIWYLIFIVALVFVLYKLISAFVKIFSKPKKFFLSAKIKAKEDRKLNKLLYKFKQKHNRIPTKHELFWIIVNTSHITIRRKGKKGHWGRQKVRKYLSEKHHVTDNYVMK